MNSENDIDKINEQIKMLQEAASKSVSDKEINQNVLSGIIDYSSKMDDSCLSDTKQIDTISVLSNIESEDISVSNKKNNVSEEVSVGDNIEEKVEKTAFIDDNNVSTKNMNKKNYLFIILIVFAILIVLSAILFKHYFF